MSELLLYIYIYKSPYDIALIPPVCVIHSEMPVGKVSEVSTYSYSSLEWALKSLYVRVLVFHMLIYNWRSFSLEWEYYHVPYLNWYFPRVYRHCCCYCHLSKTFGYMLLFFNSFSHFIFSWKKNLSLKCIYFPFTCLFHIVSKLIPYDLLFCVSLFLSFSHLIFFHHLFSKFSFNSLAILKVLSSKMFPSISTNRLTEWLIDHTLILLCHWPLFLISLFFVYVYCIFALIVVSFF